MGDKYPGDFGGGGSFEVLGETPAPAAAGKSAFNDPTSRQELEAFDAMRPLDNLNRPWPAVRERFLQLVAPVDAIGKDALQLGEPAAHSLQQRNSAMAVLNIGRTLTASRRPFVSVTICRFRP
jgi:hypothetical protein